MYVVHMALQLRRPTKTKSTVLCVILNCLIYIDKVDRLLISFVFVCKLKKEPG
jgi:hypothetical protein